MILQKLVIPSDTNKTELPMYFNGNGLSCNEARVSVSKGNQLESNTYFNSFSIGKWLQYTQIGNLKISFDIAGKCEIYLCFAWINSQNNVHLKGNNTVAYRKNRSEREAITLSYPHCFQSVIAYYKIVANSEDVYLYGASYESVITEDKINKVKIAIGICTYRREKFVERNINHLKDKIICNQDSPMNKSLDVFISDNGQSLGNEVGYKDRITVFPNKNTGGSGGFTRCLIEIKKKQAEKEYTHVILMDDDILFDASAIERTYTFLSLLKEECKNSMIGGNMLNLDKRYIQFENAGLFQDGFIHFQNNNIDIRKLQNVIQNENIYYRNFNAWCFCCMPLDRVTDENLPVPMFIHMDDVEYGVRNKFEVITLNGVGVWHPYNSNQHGSGIAYYDTRNSLIAFSELSDGEIAECAMEWLNIFHRSIFNYDYERTLSACRGIRDFCKGVDFFKGIEPLAWNQDIIKNNRAWVDAEPELFKKITKDYALPVITRKRLLLDYLLPSKTREIAVNRNIAEVYPYRIKKVILVNPDTGKKSIYKKSLRKMLVCKLECRRTKRIIRRKISKASREWKERIREVTNTEFWKEYLELD